jgi:hypothetical protein
MLVFDKKNTQITTDFEKKTNLRVTASFSGEKAKLEAVGVSINQPETAERPVS